jgi:hypothetical protein
MDSTSMTSKYMNFSPELVYERNVALNNCPTKSGRSKIYKTYYLKMKDAYEKDDEEYEAREAEEEYDASEADPSEADPSEAEASDPEDEDYVPSEEEEAEADAEEEQAEEEADAIEAEEEDVIYITEAEASEADAEDVIYITEAEEKDVIYITDSEAESEDENEFGCAGCNYEWRDGYKTGWRDAMKYITNKAHKVVPSTPACSYCDIVCKTHKCGGKCGGTARYCSLECQKQDWAFGHKAKCGK